MKKIFVNIALGLGLGLTLVWLYVLSQYAPERLGPSIVVYSLLAGAGHLLAEHKNRRQYAWAPLCAWFGPVALIVLACLKQLPGYDGQSTLRKYTRLDDGLLDGYQPHWQQATASLHDARYGDARVE